MKNYKWILDRARYMKWIKYDDPELYKYIRHKENLGRKITRMENKLKKEKI